MGWDSIERGRLLTKKDNIHNANIGDVHSFVYNILPIK